MYDGTSPYNMATYGNKIESIYIEPLAVGQKSIP
jgi:hypothetical protein